MKTYTTLFGKDYVPTLRGGGKMSLTKKHSFDIIVEQEFRIAASGGRNPENSSDRTTGSPTEQRLEINTDGVSNTLTSVHKDNLVIVANTKNGYEEVEPGDSVNYSLPNSATRRGRVGKGVAQTLDTGCNQGVVSKTRIRRLTEVECERLQGLPDNHTKYGMYPDRPTTKEERLFKRKCPRFFELHQILSGNVHKVEISATQRYKLCGNGVSIPPVKLIAKTLKETNY